MGIALSGFDRRLPHSCMQAPYLGEQNLDLVASLATEQCDPVGGVLLYGSLQFAALRFGNGIRDAAPENAKPIKNATSAAVDVRTRPTCRSRGSSFERVSEPSQK